MSRYRWTVLLIATLVGATTELVASQVRLASPSGELIDPFARSAGTKAIVLVFVSVDCPISNRYAPEIRRLSDRFASQGIIFRLIYPNPHETASTIQRHLKEYAQHAQALRDPRHELVDVTKVTVTPEAAVYDATGRLLYRGRVDDRYVNPGLQRPEPTRRDLEDALVAVLAGRPVRPATGPAVGCFIADLVQ